jgi:hypothetical protein
MNYMPYTGWFFVGATTGDERMAFFSSWGLLDTAGAGPAPTSWWKSLLIGARRLGFIG